MPRTPRPVDPEDGPIQAFAHELRDLRERHGATPYRVLARTAGYSATTLGDAAGGVRLPTLEAALAYAVACGGDAVWWEQRWTEAARLVAAQSAPARTAVAADAGAPSAPRPAEPDTGIDLVPAAGPGAVAEAGSEQPLDPAIPGPRGRRFARGRRIIHTSVLALCAVTVLAMRGTSLPGVAASAGPACPGSRTAGVVFTGMTSASGANVRSGASLKDAVVAHFPAGCELEFTGYCLGGVVHDLTGGSPDMRWFILDDRHVVASAVIHGNPPTGLSPTECADDVQAPTALSFSAAPGASGSGTVALRATGANLAIVGYAYFYADAQDPGGRWHQIGIDSAAAQPDQPWQPPARSGNQGSSVLVFAAACLGGQAPIGVGVAGVVTLRPGSGPSVSPASLDAAQSAAADQEACAYPTG
jgi:hypothetical protein